MAPKRGRSEEETVYKHQALWAKKRHLLVTDRSSNGGPGPLLYTNDELDNLFESLSPAATSDFDDADGNERENKLFALHSSSALAINFFHYWSHEERTAALTKALDWPNGATEVRFEQKFSKPSGIPGTDANVDVAVYYPDGAETLLIAIESKFLEPYRDKPKQLKPSYAKEDAWKGLPNCYRFGQDLPDLIGRDDEKSIRHLDAAQLLRHLLCIHHQTHTTDFLFMYLWYDLPGVKSQKHRREIEGFRQIAAEDGINFVSMTYQEIFLALNRVRPQHSAYLDYLRDRYDLPARCGV